MASNIASFSQDRERGGASAFDVLVNHLLSAKRSLSCVEHVSRANNLVTRARHALEENMKLSARNTFLLKSCSVQMLALQRIEHHLRKVARDAAATFSLIESKIDTASEELRLIVDQLKDTTVEPSLRPFDESKKALIDFVDETGPQRLMRLIKDTLDTAEQSRQDYDRSIVLLDTDLNRTSEFLQMMQKSSSETSASLGVPLAPGALRGMEIAAQEMADNLESLVNHFDLCVTAVKQTEGGGAAASSLMLDLPDEVGLHIHATGGIAEPVSEDERRDMLEVLEKDSAEVDEVVNEIRCRAVEIETAFERILEQKRSLDDLFTRIVAAMRLLDRVAKKLPSYLASSQVFLLRCDSDRVNADENLAEISGLRDFYAGFLLAYDELIIEVGRRKDTERRIRQVFQKALLEAEGISREEEIERDFFRQSQGEFLPIDIWPGLSGQPPRYTVEAVEGETVNVPDISASVINRAIRRVELHKRTDGKKNPH